MADGSVTIEVTLTKDQLEKGLKGLKSDIDKALPSASKTLKTFADGFDKLGSLATSAGKKITVATAGIVAGLSSAISRFDTLNNYPKVLSNLGFNAEEAKESIEELSKGIDGLPTSLDDAASGVQRLVAKNNNIKKSTKYFLAMNDAIVAGNAPAEQQASAIEQLTQSYSKGKPDLMEWRTLMMAMPGQLKQVATAMGYVDTDELYEALNKGKISMDTFMDAIVELDQNGGKGIVSFQEQAKNSCDSIGTAITNTANRFKKGFATILTSMNDAAKNTSFGSLAGMINSFSTSIKNFLDRIGETLKKNEAFKTTINQISNVLGILDNKIKSLTPEQLDKIVTTIINLAKAGPILLAVGKGFNILSGAFKGLSGVASVVEKIGGSVGQLSTKLMSFSGMSDKVIGNVLNIGGVFGKVFGIAGIAGLVTVGLGLLQSKFGEQIDSILTMVAEKGPQIITNLVNGIVSKLPDLISKGGELLQNLQKTIIANLPALIKSGAKIINSLIVGISKELPKLIENGIEMTLTIITGLIDNLDLIIDAGLKLIIGLVQGIINAIPIIIQALPKLINSILNAILGAIPLIIDAGIQLFISLVKALPDIIISIVSVLPQLINSIILALLKAIPMLIDAGIKIFVSLVEALPEIITKIVSVLPEIIDNIINALMDAIPQLIDAGITLFVSLIGALPQIISTLVKATSQIISSLITGILNGISQMIQAGHRLLSGLINGIKSMFGNLGDTSDEIINTIWNKLKELPGKAIQWGRDMIQGFINGIWNMIGSVRNAVSGIANTIKNFLHFSRPDKGPLRDYETWMPDMVKGLSKTLKSSTPELYNASKNLSNKIANGLDLSNIYNKMKSTVDFETQKLSANLSTTASVNKNMIVNLNQSKADVYLDGRKVGQSVTPYVSQTVRVGGI